jgi:hypothetical protein
MSYPNDQGNPAAAIPVYLANGGGPNIPPGLVSKGYQQVTDLTTAVALAPPTGATMAVVQVNAGIVRYRRDGTSPTATVGVLMYATGPAQSFTISDDLEFIQNSGSTGSLNVEYYGSSA